MRKTSLVVFALIFLVGVTGFVIASQVEAQVQIMKGWNLIYGFANPSQLSGQLEGSSVKAIYAFIPKTQEYARVYPDPENDKIDIMGDGYLEKTAFWVYFDEAPEGSLNEIWSSDEYMVQEPLPINELQLYAGWNFVGVVPEMNGKTLNQLKGDCNIIEAWGWWSESKAGQGWDSQGLDTPFNDFNLMKGIIMKVSNNCRLGSSGSSVNPPTLPSNTCEDSDGGKDYNEKGIVTQNSNEYQDICEKNIVTDLTDSKKLKEYYCESDGSTNTQMYTCPNGCENGACI